MALPINKINQQEVKTIILHGISSKKAPGYELVTGKILKNLPDKGLKLLTYIYNAILRLEYFPSQWKVAEVIMILKPGKNPNYAALYRPISLLPILSKVLEKILLKRLVRIIDEHQLIPKHKFGFSKGHGTDEQIHRLVNNIYNDFKNTAQL
jgi:hypothetical protein